jgi:hypothetical protein
VALVLDHKTALVSLQQFHANFDPSFHTVSQDKLDMEWQIKAGFAGQRKSKTPPTPIAETSDLKKQQNVNPNPKKKKSNGIWRQRE